MQPNVFGIHDVVSEEDGISSYQLSHTGLIFYPFRTGDQPQVLSFVNGTMCVNPLGEFICAANFDHAAVEVLDHYRLPHIDEPCIAYFDPSTRRYGLAEQPWPPNPEDPAPTTIPQG